MQHKPDFWGVNTWAETRAVRDQPCGRPRQVAGCGGQPVSAPGEEPGRCFWGTGSRRGRPEREPLRGGRLAGGRGEDFGWSL